MPLTSHGCPTHLYSVIKASCVMLELCACIRGELLSIDALFIAGGMPGS